MWQASPTFGWFCFLLRAAVVHRQCRVVATVQAPYLDGAGIESQLDSLPAR